jgi:tRNA(Ile)-lysidine synthase
MLMNTVEIVLKEKCGLKAGDALMVGVSGGPDSLALTDVLLRLGFSVYVAHFNHQLRPESKEDAAFVKEFAGSRELPFILDSGSTASYAKAQKLSIEEAARELRYQFLFDQAIKENVSAVVVGHNADDQVETVLMHLLRGAGLDGLVGLKYRSMTKWSQEIPLVRPLLQVWREEVENYCINHQLEPRYDRSNQDTTYFRNRLRHQLIPTLEEYNPNFKELFWKMSDTLSADRDLVEGLVDDVWDTLILEKSDDHVALDLKVFKSISLGLQRRILRKSIALLRPGLRDIGFEIIDYAILSISSPPQSSQTDLIAGLYLQVEEDRFMISEWDANTVREEWPQLVDGLPLNLEVPGKAKLFGGWEVEAKILDITPEIKKEILGNKNLFAAYLDITDIGTNLLIRTRQAGDKFDPLGMHGDSLKVSDFMVNVKLPRRARKNWPLVFIKNKLIWVPGYRISNNVKVKDTTKKVVRISLEKH